METIYAFLQRGTNVQNDEIFDKGRNIRHTKGENLLTCMLGKRGTAPAGGFLL